MPSSQCRIRPRHRIRPRRAAALASVAALTLAVSASGAARLPAGTTTAGPAAPARAASLGSCALAGEDDVQMSEGLRTAPGYARSTGTVRALTLMIDFSDAPGEGTAMDRFREFFRRPGSGSPPAPTAASTTAPRHPSGTGCGCPSRSRRTG